jgi:hypothetical protein
MGTDETVLAQLLQLADARNEEALELQQKFKAKVITVAELVDRGRRLLGSARAIPGLPMRDSPSPRGGGHVGGGDDELAGYMFFASGETIGECFRRSLFGLYGNDFRVCGREHGSPTTQLPCLPP